jgi:hypothetical protein
MSVFVRDRTFAARALTVLYEGGGWVKLNMRGRSARPLCGTWSSRRAGYSKLIVYGNRRAQKFEIDRCSCVGNNSGLSPLRGPGLELLLVPSLLSNAK